jgi:hypothetical protein
MTPEDRAKAAITASYNQVAEWHGEVASLSAVMADYNPRLVEGVAAAIKTAAEDAIAGERARICKILRETSVNATRELLIRGVEEGATSIWVKDEL